MGRIADWFKSWKGEQIDSSDQLRLELIKCHHSGNRRRLESLCRANCETILRQFGEWRTVPQVVRDDELSRDRYVHGLIAVAECFAKRLQHPELLNSLMGTEDDNPTLYWQRRFPEAGNLLAEMRYDEATSLLDNLLTRLAPLQGTDLQSMRAKTLGDLGMCRFEQRNVVGAIELFTQALSHCEQGGDAPGVQAYLGNLHEAHRYLGELDTAADFAEKLARSLQSVDPDTARYYERVARIVRTGEPFNRVTVAANGTTWELDDLPPGKLDRVQFHYCRNRLALRPSTVWTQRGNEHAVHGRFDKALDAYRQAIDFDPYDPDPHYQSAFVLLLTAQIADGIEACHATEQRAPGWYQCREQLWLAQQLLVGHLEHSVFLVLSQLDDGGQPPKANVMLAEQALAKAPNLASMYLRYGHNLKAINRNRDAEAAFRRGLECAAEPEVESRLCVELATCLKPGPERQDFLQRAQQPEGSLMAAAMAKVIAHAFKFPGKSGSRWWWWDRSDG